MLRWVVFVVPCTHEHTPTGQRSAAGSKVAVEVFVAVDIRVVAVVIVGPDVAVDLLAAVVVRVVAVVHLSVGSNKVMKGE